MMVILNNKEKSNGSFVVLLLRMRGDIYYYSIPSIILSPK